VETVSLELPVEIGDTQPVQYSRLVPIKHGAELLLYGGTRQNGKGKQTEANGTALF
jgi:hypothetical protein